MNLIRIAAALSAAALAVAGVAGCHSSSPGPSASSKVAAAEASASASWNAPANKPLRVATGTALSEVAGCAQTAQLDGKPLGINAMLPQPFSGQKPAVGNVPFRAERHPVKTLEAIGGCMPYSKADVKACAEASAPSSFHLHGLLGEALGKFAQCLAGKSPQPTPSAS